MASFAQILKQIIATEGVVIFQEPVRFLAVAADLSGNQHDEELDFLYVLGKLGCMPDLKSIFKTSDLQKKNRLWDELEDRLLKESGLLAGTIDARLQPYCEALGGECAGVAKRLLEQAEELMRQKKQEEAERLAAQKLREAVLRLAEQKKKEEAERLAKQKAAEEAARLAKKKAAEEAEKLAKQKATEEAAKLAKQKAAEKAEKLATIQKKQKKNKWNTVFGVYFLVLSISALVTAQYPLGAVLMVVAIIFFIKAKKRKKLLREAAATVTSKKPPKPKS